MTSPPQSSSSDSNSVPSTIVTCVMATVILIISYFMMGWMLDIVHHTDCSTIQDPERAKGCAELQPIVLSWAQTGQTICLVSIPVVWVLLFAAPKIIRMLGVRGGRGKNWEDLK